jgi:hypothetical protein
VRFHGSTALGTDRYPPFPLADVRDYPAWLDLEYPERLNRWLPLVKWLLAFPQYILVGALVGSGYFVSISVQDSRVTSYSTPSLLGACVLIAAITMVFMAVIPVASLILQLESIGGATRLLVCGVDDRPLPAVPARPSQGRSRGPGVNPYRQHAQPVAQPSRRCPIRPECFARPCRRHR